MTLPPSVSLSEELAGYPILDIEHPAVIGRIALNGAHVMEWIPEGHVGSPGTELEFAL